MPLSKRFHVEKGGYTRLAGGPDPQARSNVRGVQRELTAVDEQLVTLDRRIEDMVLSPDPPERT